MMAMTWARLTLTVTSVANSLPAQVRGAEGRKTQLFQAAGKAGLVIESRKALREKQKSPFG